MGSGHINQLVAFSMNIDDVNVRVFFKVFAQFGNENVHASGGKIIIFAPNGFKCYFALGNAVFVLAEHYQQGAFFGG